MADYSGGEKLTWWKKAAGKIFGWAYNSGWKQWALLFVSLILAVIALFILRGGVDYRKDPSALVPRSAYLFVETRDLDALFKGVGNLPMWSNDRRTGDDARWNKLQEDVAAVLGGSVGGLGRRIPLLWLSQAKNAAFGVSESDAGDGKLAWALYLNLETPANVLSEIAVEPGISLEGIKGTREEGVFSITGKDGAKMFFGSIGPWLIISSDSKLPFFAIDGYKKPAFTLGASNLLPKWVRSHSLRGMVNPSHLSVVPGLEAIAPINGWFSPDARIAFTFTLQKKGIMEFSCAQLSEAPAGGLWPFIDFLLVVLGAIGLLLALGIILVMLHWGAWLKAAAVKAGIAPASGPAAVAPSKAFIEDSGDSTVNVDVEARVLGEEDESQKAQTMESLSQQSSPEDEPSDNTSMPS